MQSYDLSIKQTLAQNYDFIFRFSFEENCEMTGSPELSMVLEKAIVLLNGKEFSALRRILAEYEATEINIDTFADSLLQLIKGQEKVNPFNSIDI